MTDKIQESEYDAILRQAVAVLPWGHILTLMRKFGEDDNAILYYAQEELKKVVAEEVEAFGKELPIRSES